MKIGLFGFDFVSSNKGCEALTYSFLAMIERLFGKEKIEVYNFTYNDTLGIIPKAFPNTSFKRVKINLKNPRFLMNAVVQMKACDLFFDATFGDGFSDIYGKKWNTKTDLIKQLVIWSGTPLILVPQTYGPYSSKALEVWAMHIIRKAKLVYTRDDASAEYVKQKSGTIIHVASDMAFKLPYDRSMHVFDANKIHVGINVSSLLWDSEWSKKNHFGLTVNYKAYHYQLIEQLLKDKRYVIHLIPHVIDMKHPDARENDYRTTQELKKKYGNAVILAPAFNTPIEAKSYISNMDVFIGSRMHATIAAISSGVATIPFSYSRKFEGLYRNIHYPYVVSARKESTKDAIEKTMKWIAEYSKLQACGQEAVKESIEKLDDLEWDIQISLVSEGTL